MDAVVAGKDRQGFVMIAYVTFINALRKMNSGTRVCILCNKFVFKFVRGGDN